MWSSRVRCGWPRLSLLAAGVLAAFLMPVVGARPGPESVAVAAAPGDAGLPVPRGLARDAIPIGGAVQAVGVDQGTGLVWAAAASGGSEDSVTGFSEATQSVTATISVPSGADALAVDQQSGLVWVTSGGTGSHASQILTEITESSGATASVNLTPASAGGRLIGVVADPGAAKVFALTSSGRLIEVPEVTPARFSVVATATVAQPGALAIDAADGRIWITSLAGDSVSAFTESGTRVGGLPSAVGVGAGPGAIAVDPDAGLVWVGNLDAGTLTEISGSTGVVLAKAISAGKGLAAVAVAPNPAHPDKGIVWTAGSFLPFTFDEFSEASTPAKLTASGPADPAGVPVAIAVDSADGQLYEGTSEGLSPFLPTPLAVSLPDSLIFWTNEPALDSVAATATALFPPPIFSISAGPSWLRIDKFSGVFHGVPPVPGKFHFTIEVRNTLGQHSSAAAPLAVNTAPVFTSPTSVTFLAGLRSRFQVAATGVPAPTFDIGGPTLPTGLTFTSTGLLSGTPAAGTEGNYQFFVGANNDPLGPVNVVQSLALHIVAGHAPKLVSPAGKRVRLRAGHHGVVTIRATGVPAAKVTIKGKLPPGLKARHGLHGAIVIAGVPKAADAGHDFRIKVTASNIIGRVTETLVIAID